MPRLSKSFIVRVRLRPMCNIALDIVNGSVQRLSITLTLLGLGLGRRSFIKEVSSFRNKFQKRTWIQYPPNISK